MFLAIKTLLLNFMDKHHSKGIGMLLSCLLLLAPPASRSLAVVPRSRPRQVQQVISLSQRPLTALGVESRRQLSREQVS